MYRAIIGVKEGDALEAEVWEKNLLRDKKLGMLVCVCMCVWGGGGQGRYLRRVAGTVQLPSTQWSVMVGGKDTDVSLPLSGGGSVLCKARPMAQRRVGFLEAFPPPAEDEIRVRRPLCVCMC